MTTIEAPGGFVPQLALSFGNRGGAPAAVTRATPLPVRTTLPPADTVALVGQASDTGLIGPFLPEPGRTIWIALTGDWRGTVRVLRASDSAATPLPLTIGGSDWGVFTANAQEPVGEESVAGAAWWLQFERTGGTLGYEVRQ
ncbi:hypothetical protein ASG37_06130 [Sphingomonas sp. Leaf407]|uniref:hypothetical protein n=1 Tax=unclassified Sphingomonas TaxID=196159 RepID=UPI0006FE72D7|nr:MULTISPECIES: hypothetical protein [unclassified Sphingomonas]KQN34187.1 hypothetical protein ASE97_16065 [Sphingomonas sp. Leaf42]KQT30630.1 hypothetical protein ASG37_06130 [Sphingomonas sp. Leaf407]